MATAAKLQLPRAGSGLRVLALGDERVETCHEATSLYEFDLAGHRCERRLTRLAHAQDADTGIGATRRNSTWPLSRMRSICWRASSSSKWASVSPSINQWSKGSCRLGNVCWAMV